MNQSPFTLHRLLRLIALIFLLTSCIRSNDTKDVSPSTQGTSTTPIAPSLAPGLSTTDRASTPTPDSTIAGSDSSPTWISIPASPFVNQIRAMLIDQSGHLWAGGPGGLVDWNLATDQPTIYAISGNVSTWEAKSSGRGSPVHN